MVPIIEIVAARELRAGRALWGFNILGGAAQAAIPELVEIASGEDEFSARSATAALAYLGKNALPPLLKLARSDRVRNEAMVGIGQMHYLGTNAHPAVLFLIESLKHPELATGAADILGRLALESDLSVPALIESLQSTNQSLRMWGAISLGRFGPEARSARPSLVKALDDSDPYVRTEATNALLHIAPEVFQPRNAR